MKGVELAWRACDVTLGSSAHRGAAAPVAASLVPAGFFFSVGRFCFLEVADPLLFSILKVSEKTKEGK